MSDSTSEPKLEIWYNKRYNRMAVSFYISHQMDVRPIYKGMQFLAWRNGHVVIRPDYLEKYCWLKIGEL